MENLRFVLCRMVTRRTHWTRPGLYLVLAALVAVLAITPVVAAGHAETVVQFDAEAGELPEGVTVDSSGNIFVSLSPLGQLVKIPAGSNVPEPFGSVAGLQEGDIGLIGLAVDAEDNVYGAVFSSSSDANGVWKFDPQTGAAERVPGTEAISMPNSIAFDNAGTMYITDTILGAVWRVVADGAAEPWFVDPMLEGDGSAGFPFPLGANGIDIVDDTVYVGTTESATIVTIPILADGSAGEGVVYADVGDGIDGIELDAAGNIYIAAPLANSVLRVNVDGSIETIASADDGLDAPTSIALGPSEDGRQNLYAVNFSVAIVPPGGAGPALVRIAVESGDMAGEEGEGGAEPGTLPTTGGGASSLPVSLTVVALTLLIAAGSVFSRQRGRV